MGRDAHAMLDDAGGGAIAVPHQRIEVRDVNQQHIGIVDQMRGIGRMRPWRVVFDVDPRQRTLARRQVVVLVFFVLGIVLEDDAIELLFACPGHRQVEHIVAPLHIAATATIAGGAVRLGQHVEIMWQL